MSDFHTRSGVRITLTEGAPTLLDIGRALSRIPRFCGHTLQAWNVAQHSLVVWKIIQQEMYSVSAQLYGLLHDAHESITGDIPRPFKTLDIKRLQDDLDVRIRAQQGLVGPTRFQQTIIQWADDVALVNEAWCHCSPKIYAEIRKDIQESMTPSIQEIIADVQYQTPTPERAADAWIQAAVHFLHRVTL